MHKLVLHQWEISPFCTKVRAILRHKGLAFEVREYAGLAARKAAGLTPTGKLPVLDYDDERIADSSAIAAAIEARHPDPPLLPADPVQRAQARLWEDWADESLYWVALYLRFADPEAADTACTLLAAGRPAFERNLMRRVVPLMYGHKLRAQGLGRMRREAVHDKLFAHLDDLQTVLGDSTWLVGDTRTLADIAIAAQISEMLRTSPLRDAISERRPLMAWVERSLPD
jgi:glutathione S-transferase